MADRAADDPAQHVAAALVARDHAVDDQERARADVVGDHLERVRRQVLGAGLARRRLDEVLEEVDLVVRVHALQHRGDPLEPHAGVDRGLRQRIEPARLVAVELHEDEVPDLDVAVAVGLGGAGRPALHLGAVVVEDLRARAARAGVAHLPEVVALERRPARLVADARDAVLGDADLLRPDRIGLVVGVIDRDPEPLGRQPVGLGEQLPRVVDRVALEVVAEAEVAEHLEERVVARGVAHVLEVVVLAAGAYAALRGGGALVRAGLLAEEHVLELHHPGVGEEERRVVPGHERGRRDDRVAARLEKLQEPRSDLGGFHVRQMIEEAGFSPESGGDANSRASATPAALPYAATRAAGGSSARSQASSAGPPDPARRNCRSAMRAA